MTNREPPAAGDTYPGIRCPSCDKTVPASVIYCAYCGAAISPGVDAAEPTPGDTYPYPVSGPGWVCFHCGERFTTPGAAEDHFGESPEKTAACRIKVGAERGLVMALRHEQRECQRLREELAHLPGGLVRSMWVAVVRGLVRIDGRGKKE